jgi:putative transposase
MRYHFIEDHREEFIITLMCRVLAVSTSGYYAWRKRPVSKREMANQTLLKEIKAVHKASGETYGSPRVYHELKEHIPCSQNRVARLMKKHSIRVKQRRCYKRTTKANAHCVNIERDTSDSEFSVEFMGEEEQHDDTKTGKQPQ